MASIYLVNALYNNSGVPAASTMQGVTQVKREVTEHHQPTAEIATATEATKPATAVGTAELATATAIGTTGPLIEAKQVETQAEQHEQQSGAGDAMHPARQLMVEFLGPLEEQPEHVPYSVSGANMQPLGQMPPPVPKMRGNGAMNGQSLGQMPPPVPRKRGKGAMNKQKLIAPELSGPGNPQPARARSFTAVAPSATAAVRFGQHPQTVGVNQIFPGRDPRRCARVGEGHEASSSPVPASLTPFGRVPIKQEEAAWECFSDQHQQELPVSMTAAALSLQRADSAPCHPMIGRDQLLRPVSTTGVMSDVLAIRPKQPDSDPASESEARIRELEGENLDLRKVGFCKDREIRMLKAELLQLGIRTSTTHDAAFEANMKRLEAGVKRPRCDEDVGGPVREP